MTSTLYLEPLKNLLNLQKHIHHRLASVLFLGVVHRCRCVLTMMDYIREPIVGNGRIVASALLQVHAKGRKMNFAVVIQNLGYRVVADLQTEKHIADH